jgi:hypothetical protein
MGKKRKKDSRVLSGFSGSRLREKLLVLDIVSLGAIYGSGKFRVYWTIKVTLTANLIKSYPVRTQ